VTRGNAPAPKLEMLGRSCFSKERVLPPIVASVAIIKENHVLLTKRDDFHVWCLPSGGVDSGESVAEAALREAYEETGLKIELTRVVGIYSRIGAIPDIHAVHFSAIPIAGQLRTQEGETIEVRYFPIDELPSQIIPGHKRRILDTFQGTDQCRLVSIRFRSQPEGPIARDEFRRLRDESSLSRSDFFMSYLTERLIGEEEFDFST